MQLAARLEALRAAEAAARAAAEKLAAEEAAQARWGGALRASGTWGVGGTSAREGHTSRRWMRWGCRP